MSKYYKQTNIKNMFYYIFKKLLYSDFIVFMFVYILLLSSSTATNNYYTRSCNCIFVISFQNEHVIKMHATQYNQN